MSEPYCPASKLGREARTLSGETMKHRWSSHPTVEQRRLWALLTHQGVGRRGWSPLDCIRRPTRPFGTPNERALLCLVMVEHIRLAGIFLKILPMSSAYQQGHNTTERSFRV